MIEIRKLDGLELVNLFRAPDEGSVQSIIFHPEKRNILILTEKNLYEFSSDNHFEKGNVICETGLEYQYFISYSRDGSKILKVDMSKVVVFGTNETKEICRVKFPKTFPTNEIRSCDFIDLDTLYIDFTDREPIWYQISTGKEIEIPCFRAKAFHGRPVNNFVSVVNHNCLGQSRWYYKLQETPETSFNKTSYYSNKYSFKNNWEAIQLERNATSMLDTYPGSLLTENGAFIPQDIMQHIMSFLPFKSWAHCLAPVDQLDAILLSLLKSLTISLLIYPLCHPV